MILSIQAVAQDEEPVLLIYDREIRKMVIGSDSPIFAYYPDGELIFWKSAGRREGQYKSVNLSGNPLEDILLGKITALENSEEYYGLTDMFHARTMEFHVSLNGLRKSIQVYGYREITKSVAAAAPEPKKPLKETCVTTLKIEEGKITRGEKKCGIPVELPQIRQSPTPTEFTELIRFLRDTDWGQAQDWQPAYLEVMVWPYEYAPEQSIVWHKEWPDLDSETTFQRGEGSFTICLPIRFEEQFLDFLGGRKTKGAVLINGKKMAISYRIPFPNEFWWRD
ncbi:MAG: hypothetical protein IH996_02530 [Proteobacteria bacterium]|nr:hypothetical protein [Pseudomonadota bacterium]